LAGFSSTYGAGKFKEYNFGIKVVPTPIFDVTIGYKSPSVLQKTESKEASKKEISLGDLVVDTVLRFGGSTKIFVESIHKLPTFESSMNVGAKHRLTSNLTGKFKVLSLLRS
jgi:hypothetical protein